MATTRAPLLRRQTPYLCSSGQSLMDERIPNVPYTGPKPCSLGVSMPHEQCRWTASSMNRRVKRLEGRQREPTLPQRHCDESPAARQTPGANQALFTVTSTRVWLHNGWLALPPPATCLYDDLIHLLLLLYEMREVWFFFKRRTIPRGVLGLCCNSSSRT